MEKIRAPYYILHGFQGYPGENWFPWLKAELEKQGEKVIVPTLPNPDKPQLNEWMDTFKQAIKENGEGTIIGHSLGGVLVMRYLEQGGNPQKIILVASPFEKLTEIPEIDNFLEKPFEISNEQIQKTKFTVFHSDDDPYVPVNHAERWADITGVKLNLLSGKGHINTSTFPEILDYL